MDSICEAAEGEIVRLKAQMPSGEWLDLIGEVAHATSRLGFGLKFVHMNQLQREKLRRFINSLQIADRHTAVRICA